MHKSLVIVESPAKANTIKKYLGSGYQVLASHGHVRELLPKKGAVDAENNFSMKYRFIEKNAKNLESIIKSLEYVDTLLLATDPDREGEAISWHLYEILKEKKLLKEKTIGRVVFHEITKRAVTEAIKHPRDLSMELVNAQQARRALDYLVGFTLSPLLWKKVHRGLSVGRVQSPALRLIVEREIVIEAFKLREYWSIEADLQKSKLDFVAKLSQYGGKKLSQFSITNTDKAHTIAEQITSKSNGILVVQKVENKQRKRNPAPPFITSTLQQEASRKLGFTTQRTMRTALQLYEGIKIQDETIGLITYMRTDSVNLAEEAINEIRALIERRYGKDNLPKQVRKFKSKSKNTQEAHEAIRPTSWEHVPDTITPYLTIDQQRLYELIWKRTVACQMIHATIDTVAVDLSSAGDGEDELFCANGSTIRHPGFMTVYQEDIDDNKKKDSDSTQLPALHKGDKIKLLTIRPVHHFTEPQPRFTEASLVKALEEYGIGRPSTYVSIISTLQNREYVVLENKRFSPTDMGRIVNKFLTTHFLQYVDYEFAAHLEDKLDAISRGEHDWLPVLHEFWIPFNKLIHETEKSVQRKDITHETLNENCPECGGILAIRLGERGRFIGCDSFPDCNYTRNLDNNVDDASQIVEGRICPLCNSQLHIKDGKYGKFIGCSNYPKCHHVEPIDKPTNTEVICPQCFQGSILQRKSRKGKIFYSCSRYPDCNYAIWNEPVQETCPRCNWPILSIKVNKKLERQKLCPQLKCGYSETLQAEK